MDALFSQGQRVNGRLFRIYSLPGDGLAAFATAKAIGCRARRNRQRRRAREAYNCHWPASVGLDVAVLVREATVEATWAELKDELGRLLEETRQRWAGGSGSP